MSAIDDLLVNAERYRKAFDKGYLPVQPVTRVTVITCMDARVDPYRLFGIAEGGAHVLRNAGGVVTPDLMHSLAVSQRLIGTTEVAVIHHTHCGMTTYDEGTFRASIEQETGARPDWPVVRLGELDDNVREAVALIRGDPAIPHRDVVRGFVFDVKDGSLREVT